VTSEYKSSGHFKIPANLTPEEYICFCFKLPKDAEHLAVFWGSWNRLGWRALWGEPLTAESDIVADYWQALIDENRSSFEEELNVTGCGQPCCPDPVTRYNQFGIQEVSNDGGATWSEAGSDPRVSGTIIPPPLWLAVGGDNRCNGAISAKEGMRYVTDLIVSDTLAETVSLLIDLILAALVAFTPLGAAAAAIIAAIAYIIVSVGKSALGTAMTEAVYDTLKCIFFCHINTDATFSEHGWQATKNDIAAQLDGLAEAWCWHIVNIAGPVGMSNMARTLLFPTGNCDECECNPCSNDRVYLLNRETDTWNLVTPEQDGTLILTSTTGADREEIWISFGNPHPNGGCCNILAWEQIDGNQIFGVDEWACGETEPGFGALPPSGCWQSIRIVSQLNPEPRQVWRLTLGDECI